jgi:hypothetical protein
MKEGKHYFKLYSLKNNLRIFHFFGSRKEYFQTNDVLVVEN